MAWIIMTNKRHISYLRAHRKKTGLTQKELAFLVGARTGTQVSRFERLRRLPPTETLIAYMIIFGKGPNELIPVLHDRIVELIQSRAATLHEELQGDRRHSTKAKLDTLETVFHKDDDNHTTL
jgi:transcriptional regulator with XRE-family HTH domain